MMEAVVERMLDVPVEMVECQLEEMKPRMEEAVRDGEIKGLLLE